MQRRSLLRALALLPLTCGTSRTWAAPGAGNTRLLLVFLRGGYDAANLLVPVSSPAYYEARPNIAIPRPGSGLDAALPLDANWGLHPMLRDTIHPLYVAGQASFIPFAGTHDLSRSHFSTQDGLEYGLDGAAPGSASSHIAGTARSGFLNRLVGVLGGSSAMAFTEQQPLIMQGPQRIPNFVLRPAAGPAMDARQSAIIAAMYRDTPLRSQVEEGFAVRDEVLREFNAEMNAANRNAISARGFELEAQRVARLMNARARIGFIDVGGWDTHVGQGGSTGQLATRLQELGKGLAAYARAMGPAWRDTVVVVMSEFGRTFRENGNRGTDHGHGTVYWVLGGGLRGARIAGEQIEVNRTTLQDNRDFRVLNEYRAVLGGLFARLYDLDAAALERIFPGAAPRDLGVL